MADYPSIERGHHVMLRIMAQGRCGAADIARAQPALAMRDARHHEQAQEAIGLALARFLDRLVRPPAHVALKWPNDLMLGPGKLGGILTEARWHADRLAWIVVGVGINVRNELPGGAAPAAARLLDAGVRLAPVELAGPVASVVARATLTADPLSSAELAEFALRDWLHGRRLHAPAVGTAEGISPGGLLRVRQPDGAVVEVFGSVALASAG